MNFTSDDAKKIVDVAYPFILPFYKALITPKVEALKKYLKKQEINNELIDDLFESKFTSYLKLKFDEFNSMNVLALPNQQIKTKDIYFPLELLSTKNDEKYPISANTDSFISKYKRILISDSAGMGKSTLIKWIALETLENKNSIPILISLRDLSKDHLIIDEISSQLDGLDKTISRELFIKFLTLGSFTILLDGLDEVTDSISNVIIKDIKNLVAVAPKNNYILTSRPENSLSSFGEFQGFKIRPLEMNEAFELIRIYDGLNQNVSISDDLIEDINHNHNQVGEFLTNPFLTSLLYRSYTFNKDIPSKKSTFYEEVISALYKTHDLSKNKYKRAKATSIDEYDLRQVLREFAKLTFKIGTSYTESEFISLLKDSKIACSNLNFKETDLLYDLECNVPIFCREGNKIRWAHKSLQDYFLACYISNSTTKESLIFNLYDKKRDNLLNVIDFLYELEPVLFREKVLLPFLQDFVSFCDTTYLNYSEKLRPTIRKRQSFSFLTPYYVFSSKNKDRDFLNIEEYPVGFIHKISVRNKTTQNILIESYGESFENILSELFFVRKIPIFEPFFEKNNPWNITKIHHDWPNEGITYLDDNPNNPMNSLKHFTNMTFMLLNMDFITRYDGDLSYILSYDKCERLIREIVNTIVNSNDDIF